MIANQTAGQRIQELQQRLDEQARNGEEGFHEITRTSAIGIVQWEGGGRLSNPNDAFLRIVGRTSAEMQVIRDCSELTPPEYQHISRQAEEELREHGVCEPFEKELLRPDGSRVPVLISAGLLGKRCPPWVAFVMDLRERRSVTGAPARSVRSRVPRILHPDGSEAEDVTADSPAMKEILREPEKGAPTDATMLLLGKREQARMYWPTPFTR